MLGSKNALILGTTGYWLFIDAYLKPTRDNFVDYVLKEAKNVNKFFKYVGNVNHEDNITSGL